MASIVSAIGAFRSGAVRWTAAVYAATALLCWNSRLLSVLQVESAAAVALVGFFAAGLSSLALFRDGWPFGRVLTVQAVLLILPLVLLTVTMLWVTNCTPGQGLLFFFLFPGITIVFAVAVAGTLRAAGSRADRTLLVALGVFVCIVPTLYDVGFHPQQYVYNHVYGGVLGPLYDEELSVRSGLFAFRGLTLLWSAVLITGSRWLERRRVDKESRTGWAWVTLVGLGLLGLCYGSSERLGWNTTDSTIRRALGSVARTDHFDIVYDSTDISPARMRMIVAEHEYRYTRLASRLGIEVPQRITSYVYPSPEEKGALTGSRTTSVVPVWLPRPQIHILEASLDASLGHELVHVFSREFGLPVVNASLSIGLVEGLAVALEPPDGRPTADEQVSAALLRSDAGGREDLVEGVVRSLGPLGFWGGRGSVSYSVTGSFVSFLIGRYGIERIMAAYPSGDFRNVTGEPIRMLVEEWLDHISGLGYVDREARRLGTTRFSQLSLFEKRCPHFVPEYVRSYREAEARWDAGDLAGARSACEASLEENPVFVPALSLQSRADLAEGRSDSVVARSERRPGLWSRPALMIRAADANALAGKFERAAVLYRSVEAALPSYAVETRAVVALRRILSGRSDAMRTLVSLPSLSRARGLLRIDRSPAGRLLAARDFAAEDAWSEACDAATSIGDLPEGVGSPADAVTVRLAGMQWGGLYCETAGRLDQAARAYADAILLARTVGALNSEYLLRDKYTRVRWKLLKSGGRKTLPADPTGGDGLRTDL